MMERKEGRARQAWSHVAGAPLREVRRGLARRRLSLTAEPGRGTSRVADGRFDWEADGADAVLELRSPSGALPSGWMELSFTLHTEAGEAASPVLLVEDASGSGAAVSIRLPIQPGGRVRALVRLPEAARALRLGPVNRRTRFRLEDACAVELGRAEATLRMAWPLALRLLREPERIPQVARRYARALRAGGLRGLDGVLGEKSRGRLSLESYEDWIRQYGTLTDADREALRRGVEALPYKPLVSVVMPTYNTPEVWLRQALDSVRAQLYPHWELCIADDASPRPEVRRVLEEYAQRDARIRFVVRPTNGHISAASNSALELARGEFVALLDHDDELSEDALARVVEALNAHPDADIVFSDEDKLDTSGRRFDPYFKPEWNLDLFRSQNLISHLGVYRTERVREVGAFRQGFEGSQDYDLALRVVERTTPARIRHVPRVLYHWRAIPGSTALDVGEKSYASTAARRALQEHLDRTTSGARVEPGAQAALHRVRYPLPSPPPAVTVILQARAGADGEARREALRRATDYPDVEWLAAPGGVSGASEAANHAARRARGEVLVFLDAHLEPCSPGWLAELVSHALRPEVGGVGAKLYTPDGAVEHAGLVLGMGPGGLAGHPHRGLAGDAAGHVGRAVVIQQFLAVSASCLAVRRAVFEAAGGFDAEHLPAAWRDVDLCLRLRERGLHTVWTPYAELTWREPPAAPAGGDSQAAAVAWLRTRWGDTLRADPFHSPNHALDWEDLRLAWPPRALPPGRKASP